MTIVSKRLILLSRNRKWEAIVKIADLLAEVCFGVGFADFILFGAFIAEGRIEWGFYALGVVLLAIFTANLTIQKALKKT
jgi:hypothetical protein